MVTLNQIVAVHETEKFFIQVDHLDEPTGIAISTVLQVSSQSEVEVWLRALCRTVRLPTYTTLPFHKRVVEHVARRCELERDYSPDSIMIFRVVHRQSDKKSQTKLSSSSDDISRNVSTICYLAVGTHKIHLIPVPKLNNRSSTSLLSPLPAHSFGILTLCSLGMGTEFDDTFTLRFRFPCRTYSTLNLASSCAAQIIQTIRHAADFLRPQWTEPSFTLDIPEKLLDEPFPDVEYDEEYHCFHRTLLAYCAAYEVDPSVIGYDILQDVEDGPRFVLLQPIHPRRTRYSVLELLAVLRSLRWNEAFGSISFNGVSLQPLKGVFDTYGSDMEPYRTRSGRKLNTKGSQKRSLLVLEIRALAACSSRLRRLDFTDSLDLPRARLEDDDLEDVDTGCEIVEAVLPLCKKGLTNVDWVIYSGVHLDQADIAWLVDAAVDKTTHIRGFEIGRCNLSGRSVNLLLDSLAAQEKTLEALDISGNPGRLNTANLYSLSDYLSAFPCLRILRLADLKLASGDYDFQFSAGNTSPIRPSFNRSISLQLPTASGTDPSSLGSRPTTMRAESSLSVNTILSRQSSSREHSILPFEILVKWRLKELDLSGTPINKATVDALSAYLACPSSDGLQILNLNSSGLKAGELAVLLGCLARDDGKIRPLHLLVNKLKITPDHNKLVDAIKKGLSPRKLTISNVDYPDEETFRKLIKALTVNRTIQYLDLSRAFLPNDANSDTIIALGELFSKNDTLEILDISGGYGRIEDGRLGAGLNKAFHSLDDNKTLKVLKVEQQRLGPQGAMVIAKMLEFNTSLKEIHCGNNGFNLQAFTALCSAIEHANRSVVAMPGLERDRKEQLDKLRADLNKTIEGPDVSASRLSVMGSLMSLDRRRSVRSLRSLTGRSSNESEKSPALGLTEEQVDDAIKMLNRRWDEEMRKMKESLAKNAGLYSESRVNTPTPASALEGTMMPSINIKHASFHAI